MGATRRLKIENEKSLHERSIEFQSTSIPLRSKKISFISLHLIAGREGDRTVGLGWDGVGVWGGGGLGAVFGWRHKFKWGHKLG